MKSAEPGSPQTSGLGHTARGRYEEAFQRVRSEIDAVGMDELLPVTIDIEAMLTAFIGRLPELNRLRQEVAALPQFRMENFDKIETYALALGQSHTHYRSASTATPIPKLVSELTRLRAELTADARSLARRGLVSADCLRNLNGSTGHKALAFDVMLLCNVLRRCWSAIEGRAGLLAAELDRADELADRLVHALGQREQRDRVLSEATVDRQRAFTLFVRAYSEVRRAVTYLRWEKPAVDRLAPSLYAGWRSRRSKAKDGSSPELPVSVATADTTLVSSHVVTAPDVVGSTANGVHNEPPPGIPGHSPFGR